MAVLKSYQELIKRTMPSQEPEEHSKCFHHRSTTLGLQIPDNNSPSWPASHLQGIDSTYNCSMWDTSHCFQKRERGQRPVHGSCLSRSKSNSSWRRFFLPWQTLGNTNDLVTQTGIPSYFLLHFVVASCFSKGYNFSESSNSRPKNYTHSRSRSKQIKNKILLTSQT